MMTEQERMALEFYADPQTWRMMYERHPYGSTTASAPIGTLAEHDGGRLARRALGLPDPADVDDAPPVDLGPCAADCGRQRLDGHATCGRHECREADYR